MRHLMYRFSIVATLITLGMLVIAAGCGGSASVIGGADCGGAATSSFSVQYPARSRPADLTSVSSALSGTIVITGAAPSPAGSDVTFNFNRDPAQIGSHNETYVLPPVAVGNFNATVTLYAGANQTGAVVGSATAVDHITCSSHSLSGISLSTTVATVDVDSALLTVGGGPIQLTFTARDSGATVVAVSPGSAIFSSTGAAATVTSDGIATPVSGGTIQVIARVDGVASPAKTITVLAGASGTYRIVDLGANQVINGCRALNDNGIALITGPDGGVMAVDVNTLTSTPIGTGFGPAAINNSNQGVGTIAGQLSKFSPPSWTPSALSGNDRVTWINDAGNMIGYSSSGGAVYWSSPTAANTSLGTLDGVAGQTVQPFAINSSQLIVGEGFVGLAGRACYNASPFVTATTLTPLGSGNSVALNVNDSGAIVGAAGGPAGGSSAVIWDSTSAAPRLLGTIGAGGTPSQAAWGINNAGTVVGVDTNATDSDQTAFVYTGTDGMRSLYSLADSTKTGWRIRQAYNINNNGWIYGSGDLNGVTHVYVAIPNP